MKRKASARASTSRGNGAQLNGLSPFDLAPRVNRPLKGQLLRLQRWEWQGSLTSYSRSFPSPRRCRKYRHNANVVWPADPIKFGFSGYIIRSGSRTRPLIGGPGSAFLRVLILSCGLHILLSHGGFELRVFIGGQMTPLVRFHVAPLEAPQRAGFPFWDQK